jgi:hypothetical protein
LAGRAETCADMLAAVGTLTDVTLIALTMHTSECWQF